MKDYRAPDCLDRLQQEVSQLREMAILQTVILQAVALKLGIAPQHMNALSPVPIPKPADLMAMLKPKG